MNNKAFIAMMEEVHSATEGDEFKFLDAMETAINSQAEKIGAIRIALDELSRNYQTLIMMVSKRRLHLLQAQTSTREK